MKRHWPETRRRWFLLAFAASTWLFALHFLASFVRDFATDGIGTGTSYTAAMLASVALNALLVAIFRLPSIQFIVALTLGLSVSAVLEVGGLTRLGAAGIWSAECERGEGTACSNLARFYASGQTWLGGALDAAVYHRKACALGGPGTTGSCEQVASPSAGNIDPAETCAPGSRRACEKVASEHAARGDYMQAYRALAIACQETGPGDDLAACTTLVDSGYPEFREVGCDEVEKLCRSGAAPTCSTLTARCRLSQSRFAGTLRP